MFSKVFLLHLAIFSTFPALASSIEQVPANEDGAIQQIVRMTEESVRTESKNGAAHRDAHPKANGCVQAKFSVLHKLPEEVQVGIFKGFLDYPAWIRYSNGSGKVQDDSVGDARGMAIKLMGVKSSESGTQDFVMINHPVFFVRNAADYVDFQKALSEDNIFKYFFPGLNPFNFRLHELGIANDIRRKEVVNPLDTQYWSTTPYRNGDKAMKFSVRSCSATSTFRETSSPNFLRENMSKQLDQGDACFDFMVQLRKHPMKMPIEDPTVEWSEEDSPFIPVAKITIPRQKFDSPNQVSFCENLSFTPWHTIPEHQPLGGINRVRKTVYDTVSRVRHELNVEPRREPTGF
ncbi:catalase [Methyloglobulus morosus KoM1]|uniref:catalase n=1 Tax=Methyloglobulus morosus KoM1 TaxID=1116472 RepID=V5C394_9GAMM|nr:catalase family protein [Methyloglobulus morosus]ESS71288.1 catalase [Methyloglobulus morosus KoM1]